MTDVAIFGFDPLQLMVRREESRAMREANAASDTDDIEKHYCPSQGSHYFMGTHRGAQVGFDFNSEPSRARDIIDHSWKRQRKTPWRREASDAAI